jgi:hypothetical protein
MHRPKDDQRQGRLPYPLRRYPHRQEPIEQIAIISPSPHFSEPPTSSIRLRLAAIRDLEF